MVRFGLVQSNSIRFGSVRPDLVQSNSIQSSPIWSGSIWFDLVRSSLAGFGLVVFGLILSANSSFISNLIISFFFFPYNFKHSNVGKLSGDSYLILLLLCACKIYIFGIYRPSQGCHGPMTFYRRHNHSVKEHAELFHRLIFNLPFESNNWSRLNSTKTKPLVFCFV